MQALSWLGAFAIAAVLVFAGCKDKAEEKKDTPATGGGGSSSTPAATDEHAGHDHDHTAPHGGDIIELGNEEYHAELVHDEAAHKVTIYLYDGHLEKTVAIPDKSITVNLKMDGKPTQVSLKAAPESTDPTGKSSRFELADEEFAHALDEEDAAASLSLKIDGKSFKGKIVHAHEGEHAHSHD